MQETLEKQMTARGFMIGSPANANVQISINTFKADVQEGSLRHNITVNIIKNSQVVDKKALSLPKKITNVIRCKNPRCITSIEQELDHVFVLTDPENEIYRCQYCEEKYHGRK